MDHQDWKPVILRKNPVRVTNADVMKNPTAQNTVIKASAAKNKQTLGTKQPTRDVDITDPDYVAKPVKTYDLEFRKRMQQARQEKKLSQKDLAARLNVKPTLISEIESGKGDWDGPLVSKIEKILGSLRK